MKKALGFLILAALLPLQCAFAHPKMFSDLSLADAKAKAKHGSKYVLIDFTATWCGPCKRMDKTTWSDPIVEKWVADNAIAIQIDVDKDHPTSEALNVHAMPTIVVFRASDQSKEFDRKVGLQSTKELMSWLANVKAGKTSSDLLTAKLKAVAGKGGDGEVQTRYEIARAFQDAGKNAEATEQFVWLWTNIEKQSPAMVGVRGSFMADEMAQLAAKYPPAKLAFDKLRDAAEATNERRDWMVLNDVVGEPNKTLQWFDTIKTDPAKKADLKKVDFLLERLLVSKRRWADICFIYPDATAELAGKYKFAEMVRASSKKFDPSHEYNPFPNDVGLIYASYLAAGKDADADKIAQEALKLEDTPSVRLGLVAMALKANQPRASQLELLKTDTPLTHQLLGSLQTLLKNYDAAIKEFDKAVKADARDAYSLVQRGGAHTHLKQYDLAKADFDQALKLDVNDASAHDGLSDLYFHQGKFQEALDVANRAKTMDPKAPSSYCNAGEALFGLGRYDEALTNLSKSIEIDPTVGAGEDYFYRAKTYEKLGKLDLAEKDRESAKKLGFTSDDN